jgi:hypothetical protein
MKRQLCALAIGLVASVAPIAATAAHAAPVPERGQSWVARPEVPQRGQSWVARPNVPQATTSPSPFYSGTYRPYRPTYGTGPVMPPKYFDRDRNGNTRDAKTNGLSDMPPSNVTPHIVCFRVGGGFCWVPFVW